jgi:hypothetical protein
MIDILLASPLAWGYFAVLAALLLAALWMGNGARGADGWAQRQRLERIYRAGPSDWNEPNPVTSKAVKWAWPGRSGRGQDLIARCALNYAVMFEEEIKKVQVVEPRAPRTAD